VLARALHETKEIVWAQPNTS